LFTGANFDGHDNRAIKDVKIKTRHFNIEHIFSPIHLRIRLPEDKLKWQAQDKLKWQAQDKLKWQADQKTKRRASWF
jgi:hypothetical protein